MNSTVPFASDLSFQVFQKQRRDPEVVLTPANQATVIRQSRLDVVEMFSTEEIVRADETPTWHFRGRKGRQ